MFLFLQRMTIYYRDHLGTYPYLSHEGGKVNGGLPQLGNLSVHLALTTTEVSGMLRPNFTGLGVIDWEEWHPLWGRNSGAKRKYRQLSKLLVKQQSPHLSQRATVAAARREFEESARKYMEGTLQAAIRERPRGHWGFYGFPVCFNKQRTTGRCTFISPESQRNRPQSIGYSVLSIVPLFCCFDAVQFHHVIPHCCINCWNLMF